MASLLSLLLGTFCYCVARADGPLCGGSSRSGCTVQGSNPSWQLRGQRMLVPRPCWGHWPRGQPEIHLPLRAMVVNEEGRRQDPEVTVCQGLCERLLYVEVCVRDYCMSRSVWEVTVCVRGYCISRSVWEVTVCVRGYCISRSVWEVAVCVRGYCMSRSVREVTALRQVTVCKALCEKWLRVKVCEIGHCMSRSVWEVTAYQGLWDRSLYVEVNVRDDCMSRSVWEVTVCQGLWDRSLYVTACEKGHCQSRSVRQVTVCQGLWERSP